MVALGFMAATWVMVNELKRKERAGLMQPGYEETIIGAPATAMELFWSAIIGFFLGFKAGGFFTLPVATISENPMGYFLSTQGNILTGIAGAAVLVFLRWNDKKKKALPEPKKQRTTIYPHQRIGEILIMAALGGLIGAKVFNAFETWEDFLRDPIGSLTSSRGLTFYGGFIVATAILYYFSRKYKIRFVHFCDAATPAVMIAYGIGRLGCQFAGDGDWGIYNSAYVTNAATGKLEPATAAQFQEAVKTYRHYLEQSGHLANGEVPHAMVQAPSWLPQALYAQCYPHNVNNVGIPLPDCQGEYCQVLPIGVFPTPLYEAIVCIGLFFVLWGIRKRIKTALHLSAIYFIMSGLERFFVEKIRVNYKYDWGFLHPTQAEIISTCMVLLGVCILLFYKDKKGQAEAMAVPAV